MSTADTVNEWFRERLCGGELARHTPAYNQVAEALQDLIARLDPPAPAVPEPPPAPAPALAPAKASKAAAAVAAVDPPSPTDA